MGLIEIKTLQELIAFLPLLVKMHGQFDALSETQGSAAEFVANLTNNFGKNSYYYGLKIDNELCYFIVVLYDGGTDACFWMLYINKEKRQYTKNLLYTLRSEFKRKGVKTAEWKTTILKRSYERWVGKFGAKKHAIIYKMEL